MTPTGKKGLILQVCTMDSKWDINKFWGDKDIGLWKVKIKAFLT